MNHEILELAHNKKSLQILDLQAFLHFEYIPCTAYGNRTRDSSVKGMRLNPLTNAAKQFGIAKVISNRIFPK